MLDPNTSVPHDYNLWYIKRDAISWPCSHSYATFDCFQYANMQRKVSTSSHGLLASDGREVDTLDPKALSSNVHLRTGQQSIHKTASIQLIILTDQCNPAHPLPSPHVSTFCLPNATWHHCTWWVLPRFPPPYVQTGGGKGQVGTKLVFTKSGLNPHSPLWVSHPLSASTWQWG